MCFGGKSVQGFLLYQMTGALLHESILIPHKNVRDENHVTLGNRICF